MSTKNELKALNNFNKAKIMVIGDMILDRYLFGEIERISREAPVLVLQQTKEKNIAGGAANVVNNISSLGGEVICIGALGNDIAANNLKNIFSNKKNILTKGLISFANRNTITKTRIIAGGRATVSQQVVRIDKDCKASLNEEDEDYLLSVIKSFLPKCNGIILSDYGSGTITKKIRQYVINYAKENNIPAMVDSRYDITSFSGITYVKQNDTELANALKIEIKNDNDLYKAGHTLQEIMNAKGILVTRGEKGMTLFLDNGKHYNIPVSDKSEVYDVSGAGDTCVATFMLAVATNQDEITSAYLSNYAAGIAVRKVGTATVSKDELIKVLEKDNDY